MNDKFPLALPVGTVLQDKYTIESVLGQGGFGITYKAVENASGQAVAIKEFFPDSLATRTGVTVTSFSGERATNYTYGLDCFLEEAKTLAQFGSNPGVVNIRDYFECNNTAYFVMEFIEGKSFEELIKENGGRIEYKEAEKVLLPVIEALGAVHAQGIIHRDVTPDNIYITNEGDVKLLDFGAARYSLGDKSRSLDVVLKHGYAPKEQYSRHGRQGPYTDVYTVGVCFYFALTGRRPPDSIDRLEEDDLIPLSTLGVELEQYQEDAILKAMAVQPADRFNSMQEFKTALLGGETASQTATEVVPSAPAKEVQAEEKKAEKSAAKEKTTSSEKTATKKKPLVPIIIGVAVLAVASVCIFVLPKLGGSKENTGEQANAGVDTGEQVNAGGNNNEQANAGENTSSETPVSSEHAGTIKDSFEEQIYEELNFNNLIPGGYAAQTNGGTVYYVQMERGKISLVKNTKGVEKTIDHGDGDMHDLCVWGEDVVYNKDNKWYRYHDRDGSIEKLTGAFAKAHGGIFAISDSQYLTMREDGKDNYSLVMLSATGETLGSVSIGANDEFVAILDGNVYFVGEGNTLCKTSLSDFGKKVVDTYIDVSDARGLTAYNGKLYFGEWSGNISYYDPKTGGVTIWRNIAPREGMGLTEMSILDGELYIMFNDWYNYTMEIREVGLSSLREETIFEKNGACGYCIGFSDKLDKLVFGHTDGESHNITAVSIK
ncbi:MAG: serine/threonine protein kinase [Lachnospiraceae bacterium]|nr:serine/threonine protein kinase [Lachnospiraceae bacterium]